MLHYRRLLPTLIFTIVSLTGFAEFKLSPYGPKAISENDTLDWVILPTNPIELEGDTLLWIEREDFDSILNVVSVKPAPLPRAMFGPAVFGQYKFIEPVSFYIEPIEGEEQQFSDAYRWLDEYEESQHLLNYVRQAYEIDNPLSVKYNTRFLPEVPKEYRAYVNNVTARIEFEEIKIETGANVATDIERKVWLHKFDASLQFSQAYISPNWYQGGNNNLNMIGQLLYNVKLNQKFYPKVLFEATVQYKLAMNSAPDDSIHTLNITEDIFQINATAGYKAARNWYYSANLMFKTQLFNSYPTNSRVRQASLLSPGELNIGLGMTYSHTNKKKTFSFGASISPLSWNLKTCIDKFVDETDYGLEPGHRTKNKVGSSAECTLEWKITYNIIYHSRLFLFTDYEYAYGDWEHTVDFNINRFLSTRLYVHMRYDTSTPPTPDSKWKKFQLKEIFSFGFAYHFGTI